MKLADEIEPCSCESGFCDDGTRYRTGKICCDDATTVREALTKAAGQLRSMESLLINAEGMLIDVRAGKTANDLAVKIVRTLN